MVKGIWEKGKNEVSAESVRQDDNNPTMEKPAQVIRTKKRREERGERCEKWESNPWNLKRGAVNGAYWRERGSQGEKGKGIQGFRL